MSDLENETAPDEPGAPPAPEPTPEPTPEPAPDDEPADDDEDGDEPEPGAEPTPEQQAKALKQAERNAEQARDKLDREAQRHRTRLAEILQEDILSLVPCELCRADLAGWVETLTPIPEEVKSRVRIQIGDREPEQWQPDTFSRRCDVCDGLAEVLTGSRKHGQETLPCINCQGKGWVAVGTERQGVGTGGPVYTPPVPQAVAEASNGPEPPEVAALRAMGYAVIKPTRVG